MNGRIHKVNSAAYFDNLTNIMASYPSGLRGRFAKPLFAGSNPADASFRHSTIYFSSDLARVVELVDTTDLKSVGCISRAGSSPAPGTLGETPLTMGFFVWRMMGRFHSELIGHMS